MARQKQDLAAFRELMRIPSGQRWANASTFKATGREALYQWALGYGVAARALSKRVQDQSLPHPVCLPLGFLYFHAIELHLKTILSESENFTGLEHANWRDHRLRKLVELVEAVPGWSVNDGWQEHRTFLIQWDAGMPGGYFLRYAHDSLGTLYDSTGKPEFDFESGETMAADGVPNYQLGGILERAEKALAYLEAVLSWIHDVRTEDLEQQQE